VKFGFIGKAILAIVIGILCWFIYGLIQEIAFDNCGLSESYAREKVLKHLRAKNLPEDGLSYDSDSNTCMQNFSYLANGADISFTVLSTWQHGTKLTWYDNTEDRKVKP
jgi:hypothetical protein